ncbi:MAG TPA: hypothetical protein VG755_20965 [Nannocystaceae bacterium]|nr:hypothetical protein [Nannocystaceae bacterium]
MTAAKPTVVLACSAADATALAKVLKSLVDAGLRVDVCAGVEVDARALQRSLARADARTIFTLCRGRNLDGVQLEHLYRLVRQSGIPSERAFVLRFEHERADELASTLLARLAQHGLTPEAGTPELLSSQDVTSPVLVIPRELADRSLAAESTTQPIAIDDAPPAIAARLRETPPVTPERSQTEMRISAVLRAKPDPRSRTRVLPAMAAIAMVVLVLFGVRFAIGAGQSATIVSAGLAPAPARPLAVLAPAGPALPAHVSAALAHGTIRAMQGLLVAIEGDTAMHNVVARKHCEKLYVAGLSDWRVPTRAELELLGSGGFLPASTTWWHDGDAKDKPRAKWDGARMHTLAPAPKAAARTVCVHAP